MSKFTANVTLFDATPSDYARLQEELVKKLLLSLKSIRQTAKELSFTRAGNIGIQELTKEVLKAARLTGKKYSFTIIKHKPVV